MTISTTPTLRPELQALPRRMQKLPLDDRGYPVPWFVAWIDGKPEFRAADGDKRLRALRDRLCWTCGEAIGVHLAFVLGPMCALNRTIAEPANHYECAKYSALNCPFLSRPRMRRREDEIINATSIQENSPGCAIQRNPGAVAIWITRSFSLFDDGSGGVLIHVGEPERVEWYSEGRWATREEVMAATDSGLPLLEEQCERESNAYHRRAAREELARRRREVERLWPAT